MCDEHCIAQRLSHLHCSEPRIVPGVAGRVVAGVDDVFEALIVLAHETLHRVGHCPGLLPRACLCRSEIRAPDAAAPDAELCSARAQSRRGIVAVGCGAHQGWRKKANFSRGSDRSTTGGTCARRGF